MKRIVYSAALTAMVAMVGLKLVGWQNASPLGEMEGEGLFAGNIQETAGSVPLEPTHFAGRPGDWRTVVAGEETGLAKPDADRVADPVGAFQRWAREFMDGTADLEEGLRLARARRAVTARLIRDNPRQAIANRVDDDTRAAISVDFLHLLDLSLDPQDLERVAALNFNPQVEELSNQLVAGELSRFIVADRALLPNPVQSLLVLRVRKISL